ncbi:MAG: ankyrin repeat domain-containing protein [Candidatus Berkiella sp.]
MDSKETFNELEGIRTKIQSGKISTDEAKTLIADLKSRLLKENPKISEIPINASLAAFQNVFVDNALPDENALKSELMQTLPKVNFTQCSLKVYQAILPYTKLMYEFEKNGVAVEHAYKLSVIFNDEKKALNYLKEFIKANPQNKQVMHDANLYALPSGSWDISIWRELCNKYMKDSVFRSKILPRADVLEAFIKSKEKTISKKEKLKIITALSTKTQEINRLNAEYKKLNRKAGTFNAEEQRKFNELAEEISAKQRALTELGASFSGQLNLTILQAFLKVADLNGSIVLQYFLANGLTEKDFAKFVNLERKDDPTQIPFITIDGKELGYPGIYLMKVDVLNEIQAARAACLGKLTNCCQSLSGEAGQPCVIHGLTSEYGGFYVVCEGNAKNPSVEDKLLGQCWAWRSQSGALVFDSIESSNMYSEKQTKILKYFYETLGQRLVLEGHAQKVVCGKSSGISREIGVNNYFDSAENFKDYNGYCDSTAQQVIYDRDRCYYFYGRNEEITIKIQDYIKNLLQKQDPLTQNQALVEMLNWAILEEKEDILQKTKELLEKDKQEALDILIENIRMYIDNKIEVKNFLQEIERNELPINIRNKINNMPLYLAAEIGLSDTCLALIEKGADVNAKNIYGKTVLYLAVENGLSDTCLALIEKGADVNAKNIYGKTVLYLAVENGLSDTCLALIEKGADVNVKYRYGKTALHLAAENGLSDTCLALIEKGVDVNVKDRYGRTALHLAVEHGHSDTCLKLIEKGADLNEKDNSSKTAFNLAIKNRQESLAILLFEKGALKNVDLGTIDMAAKQNCHELVQMLLLKIDPHYVNGVGYTMLMEAVRLNMLPMVKKLIEDGADVNATNNIGKGNTALMSARNQDIVDVLIENNANINAKNKDGETALIRSAMVGRWDIVKLLIEKGADIDIKDNKGRTLFDYIHIQDKRNMVMDAINARKELEQSYKKPIIFQTVIDQSLNKENQELLNTENQSKSKFKK